MTKLNSSDFYFKYYDAKHETTNVCIKTLRNKEKDWNKP